MNDLVFKNDNVELFLGEQVVLCLKECDKGFFTSPLGQKGKRLNWEEYVLTAFRRDWLEVYFVLTIYREGEPISTAEFHESPPQDESRVYEGLADYSLLRYFLNKGAKKASQRYAPF